MDVIFANLLIQRDACQEELEFIIGKLFVVVWFQKISIAPPYMYESIKSKE